MQICITTSTPSNKVNPLINTRLWFFSKYGPILMMYPIAFYHHANNQKLLISFVLEKMSKNQNVWHLIPLHLWIKIFLQNSSCVTFFTLLTQTSCKVSGKNNVLQDIERRTDWRTNWKGRLLWTPSYKPWVQKYTICLDYHLTTSLILPALRCAGWALIRNKNKSISGSPLKSNCYLL